MKAKVDASVGTAHAVLTVAAQDGQRRYGISLLTA